MKRKLRSSPSPTSSTDNAQSCQSPVEKNENSILASNEDNFQRMYSNMFLVDRGPNKRKIKPKHFEDLHDLIQGESSKSAEAGGRQPRPKKSRLPSKDETDDSDLSKNDVENDVSESQTSSTHSEEDSDESDSSLGSSESDSDASSEGEEDDNEDESPVKAQKLNTKATEQEVGEEVPCLSLFIERWRQWVRISN